MKLITRKSECKRRSNSLVKTPKEAIRKTLNNYIIKNGVIVNIYQPSYVSREEMVLCGGCFPDNMTIKLESGNSFINIHN